MTLFSSLDELLRHRKVSGATSLFVAALLCYAAYGAGAGFFQGGWQIAVAIWKVPLIIIGSLLLCTPSLYVFSALGGMQLDSRAFVRTLAGFAGIAGLILIALMPVVWLFSVSTLSIAFVVVLHLFGWVAALLFGRNFLLKELGAGNRAAGAWVALLLLVSLQMTTYLRPVLWRDKGEPLFGVQKISFLTHFASVTDWKR